MTVRPVAEVAFALCQAFYKGICLLSLPCNVAIKILINLVLHGSLFIYIVRITIRWIKGNFVRVSVTFCHILSTSITCTCTCTLWLSLCCIVSLFFMNLQEHEKYFAHIHLCMIGNANSQLKWKKQNKTKQKTTTTCNHKQIYAMINYMVNK